MMNNASGNENPVKPDLKTNYIFKMIQEIVLLAAPLITVPYVSRVLGAEGIGDFSFLHSVISYFMMFAALGMADYGTREIARVRDDKKAYSRLFWEIRITGLIPGLICLALWIVVIAASGENRILLIALTPYLVGTLFDISWFYMGLERIRGLVIADSAVRMTGVVLMFVMVKESSDVAVYTAINAFIILVSCVCMWIFLPGQLSGSGLKNIPYRKHLKEMFVYFIPTVALSVYLVLDKTLIGVITKDPSQNGYYEQADKIIRVAKTFSFGILSAVATARMSYLYASDKKEEMNNAVTGSMDLVLFIGYGAVFGLIGISPNLVPVFFGQGYEPVETLIYLMLPLIPIISISNCLESHYYIPSGKRARSSRYIVTGAVLNLAMNLCLIPFLGAKGAVLASIAAELAITILFMYNCEGCVTAGMIGSLSVKRLAAGLIMAAALRFIGTAPITPVFVLFIQLLCGVVLYAFILILLKDTLVTKFVRIK